jgi:hypothetical protein
MWIITAWQHISPEVTVKGFKKCHVSNGKVETDDYILWNGSEEDGMLRVSVRMIRALTVTTDRPIPIGKGR